MDSPFKDFSVKLLVTTVSPRLSAFGQSISQKNSQKLLNNDTEYFLIL